MLPISDFNITVCYQTSLCIKDICVAAVIYPKIEAYNVMRQKDFAMIILLPLTISRLIQAKK